MLSPKEPQIGDSAKPGLESMLTCSPTSSADVDPRSMKIEKHWDEVCEALLDILTRHLPRQFIPT